MLRTVGAMSAHGESSLVHIFACMLLEECLLVETLGEYSGAPEKHPENVGNLFTLSSVVRAWWQRQWPIVGPGPPQHCAGKGTAL